MENTFFKIIGQKASDGKMILVAVVDDNLFGEGMPSIFELQAFKMAPNIYTGTYPQIKINSETIKDRQDLKGLGIDGILTTDNWYCKSIKEEDILGIGIKN